MCLSAPGILSKGSTGSQQARLTPSHSHNSSITASPFNANILQVLGQQQMTTPTSKSMDILDDSLGMLSTVALLDSEMSDVNTSAGTSVQERLAGMKITSHHGTRGYSDIHVACFIGEQPFYPLDICLSGSNLRKFLPILLYKVVRCRNNCSLFRRSKLDHWFTLHSSSRCIFFQS